MMIIETKKEEKTIFDYEVVILESRCTKNKVIGFYERNEDKIIVIDNYNNIDIIEPDTDTHWIDILNNNGYFDFEIIKYIRTSEDIKITIEV